MISTIDEVMEFVQLRPDYRATIGIIKATETPFTCLAWAAIHIENGHQHVPYLSTVSEVHPDARWTVLTPKDLHTYLRDNKQDAFLLSERSQENTTENKEISEEVTSEKSA